MGRRPAVLWDIDGVLIAPWQFRDKLEGEYGISPEVTGSFFADRFRDCLVGEADLRYELRHRLGDWGWSDSVDRFMRLWFEAEKEPVAEVMDFVAELQRAGYPCYIASNQERYRARYLSETVGFSQVFDELFFSSRMGVRKPDSAFYVAIQEELGRSPSELVLVDDSLANVEAARVLGWTAVHFRNLADLTLLHQALGGFA